MPASINLREGIGAWAKHKLEEELALMKSTPSEQPVTLPAEQDEPLSYHSESCAINVQIVIKERALCGLCPAQTRPKLGQREVMLHFLL